MIAPEVCAETAALFAVYVVGKRRRQRAHIEHIEREARRLGTQVGSFRMLLADAETKLDRLCDVLDAEATAVPLRLVPLAEGRSAARRAFHAGMADAKPVPA